ncbi:MAG: type II 3-dehydroquinate dehydratase [Gammaproteobacteria bacterium]|jgi:3-dehydroquinate dehydratase-2|uniref:3-dehydroquinate dehydratase n=1 Tax=SAR86 cluster bacterium TaxID=2030880 RepID=A0A838YR68_9GAMM|nr:type II 3-dehydroquinate dehydratase [SAR86 cluster bacterium]|tara:strand:- start:745 stop:1179 length:435 start_codon:yes stop_codon:yes gene_type:complete
MKLLVINGPNLNLLGTRENNHYGDINLEKIENNLLDLAKMHECSVDFFQSNAEHELVDKIQTCISESYNVIIINPGAFTHTSIALRDALLAVNVPFYEVHISNIFGREEFRHHSYFSDIATGVICGLGASGYEYALLDSILKFK